MRRTEPILLALGIASALSASCAEKHRATGDGGGGGGGGGTSCYAAGLADPPITCPEGCYEIHGQYAEGCVPSVGAQSAVVGCRPDIQSITPWLETCFLRERDGGLPLIVRLSYLEDSMGEQGYVSCNTTSEAIPTCPTAP